MFLGTLLSCLGLPIPAAIILLAGGALAAVNESSLGPFFIAAYTGAIIGGTSLFAFGRTGSAKIVARMSARPGWSEPIERARDLIDRRGGTAVFIGSWLLAQIGPAVNLVSGAGGLDWVRFTLWHLPGRVIWVGGYLTLGYAFSDQITEIAVLLSNLSWVAIGGIAVFYVVVRFVRRSSSLGSR